MASGPKFQDSSKPQVLLQVGPPAGAVGAIQMSDLLVTQQGQTGGFIGLEWNIRGGQVGTQSQPGMWVEYLPILILSFKPFYLRSSLTKLSMDRRTF